jgi:hypothetical protein
MPSPALPTPALLAFGALIVWRLYSRFRKMVGRQRLTRARPWITVGIYSLLVPLIASSAFAHPARLWWLAAGLVVGVALSVVGLRYTKFEAVRGVGLFYTPNAHLGLALSAMFVARIGYRLIQLNALDSPATPIPPDSLGSPATLFIFGLLAAYYLGYAVGLIRWRRAVFQAKQLRGAAPAEAESSA